jgi:toxin ParE1/3/4
VKVRFTPTARGQFLAALHYIRADNPEAAARFRQRAETVLRRLDEFPDSGRSIPEFPDLPYREVVIAPYRFFYRQRRETVWGVAVWHGAQLPRNPQEESDHAYR